VHCLTEANHICHCSITPDQCSKACGRPSLILYSAAVQLSKAMLWGPASSRQHLLRARAANHLCHHQAQMTCNQGIKQTKSLTHEVRLQACCRLHIACTGLCQSAPAVVCTRSSQYLPCFFTLGCD
jgi:hypothetical protein